MHVVEDYRANRATKARGQAHQLLSEITEEEELRNLILEGERNKEKGKEGGAGETDRVRESPRPTGPATPSLLLLAPLSISPFAHLDVSLAFRFL